MKRDYYEEFKKVFVESGEATSFPPDIIKRLRSDPSLLGLLIAQLINERRRMNALLKEILDRLDRLESQRDKKVVEEINKHQDIDLLPPSDRKIINIIKSMGGKCTAEDVRKAMGYKGRNAASARLNRLYSIGIVKKKQVGKKVFFILNGEATS